MEQNELECQKLVPGTHLSLELHIKEKNPRSIFVHLVRPLGQSAATAVWKLL